MGGGDIYIFFLLFLKYPLGGGNGGGRGGVPTLFNSGRQVSTIFLFVYYSKQSDLIFKLRKTHIYVTDKTRIIRE